MNVDEAMETAKAYLVAHEQMQEPLFESEEVAVTLAREVERLQVWKTRWKDAAQKLRRQLEESGDGDTWRRACRRVELELEKTHTEVERLRAELSAAKAASVVPEESAIWLLAVAAKLEKDGEWSGLDSMTKAANWLRDRMGNEDKN